MEHFNKLTPAEAERLAWLAEECSEVIKAVTKILRHGYDSYDPTNPNHKGNRADLEAELIDVLHAITFMLEEGDIADVYGDSIYVPTLLTYMHHQTKFNENEK